MVRTGPPWLRQVLGGGRREGEKDTGRRKDMKEEKEGCGEERNEEGRIRKEGRDTKRRNQRQTRYRKRELERIDKDR